MADYIGKKQYSNKTFRHSLSYTKYEHAQVSHY